MQRYFIPATNWQSDKVFISGDDVHHVTRVMRYKEGSKIICNNPDGNAAICVIDKLEHDYVQATIMERLNEITELPVNVTIAQGLAKGDKFDLVLQKGTELGAEAFIPFQAERSVVVWDKKKTEKKLQRFEKIVKEASEQSHRNKVPEIREIMNIDVLIRESSNYDVLLFAYEEEAKTAEYQSFAAAVSSLKEQQNILVCVGPEGGFSLSEVDKLKENGFSPVRLGPRILRTETAPLYVLASISYHFEELGCK
ncbi:16S rRNA (uracil(1498)-N(3))-methyltransferase [Virgibacillus sp. FSP13]